MKTSLKLNLKMFFSLQTKFSKKGKEKLCLIGTKNRVLKQKKVLKSKNPAVFVRTVGFF